MPRPMIVNAKRQPAPPLNVEELKFWLRIMEEHALFICAGLPCDNAGLINETETYQQEFAALQAQAEGALNDRRFAELVAAAQSLVEDFYRFIRRLVNLALTCQIVGCNFALFLDHMSREAEYFARLLDKISVGQAPLFQVSSAREAAFWLRLMADHAEFIVHRLDPSERNLIGTADDFASEFDELYLQGRDYISLLRGAEEEIPAFRRFLQDSRAAVARLRDFNKAAELLACECKLVGLVPAVLADHMRREADHFLLVLALLEKAEYVPFIEEAEMEYLDNNETLAAQTEECVPGYQATPELPEQTLNTAAGNQPNQYVGANTQQQPKMSTGSNIYMEDTGNKAAYTREDELIVEIPAKALPAELATQPEPPVAPAQPKKPSALAERPKKDEAAEQPENAKFKWSGKWPRPLGSKPQ